MSFNSVYVIYRLVSSEVGGMIPAQYKYLCDKYHNFLCNCVTIVNNRYVSYTIIQINNFLLNAYESINDKVLT